VASYFLSQKFEIKLIDMMFYVGVFTTAISLYFTSEGGIVTNYSEAETASSFQGLKSKHTFKRIIASLNLNFINVGSILFPLIVITVSLFY
jgi:hypothetical protein